MNTETTEQTTEVAIIGIINPIAVFVGINDKAPEATARIEEVEKAARAEAKDLDPTTADGRKSLASLAYKVSQTKTGLVGLGKGLTEDARAQIKLINAECNTIETRLADLRDEIRQPVTNFENKEKDRVAAHETAIECLAEYATEYGTETSAQASALLETLTAKYKGRAWEEFSERAERVYTQTCEKLTAIKDQLAQAEANQAELERLRAEQAEREAKERDERIAAEAAENARVEAEQKAEREAEAVRAKAQAEQAEANRLRVEAEEREPTARRETEEAEARAAEAAANERQRIADEQAEEDRAALERENNKKHRSAINNAALKALVEHAGLSKEAAKAAVTSIASGKIPAVKISY